MCIVFIFLYFTSPRIAYIDSGKLLVGFSEANAIEREIKADDDKWQLQLKVLEDSLQATVTSLSKEYDKAGPAKKRELSFA